MVTIAVLPVGRDIFCLLVRWILARETDMPLKMLQVARLRAPCQPCWKNQFAKPEVTICTENISIPALWAGIMFPGERREYPPQYLVQHLSVCLLPHITPFAGNLGSQDWNWQKINHYEGVH